MTPFQRWASLEAAIYVNANRNDVTNAYEAKAAHTAGVNAMAKRVEQERVELAEYRKELESTSAWLPVASSEKVRIDNLLEKYPR